MFKKIFVTEIDRNNLSKCKTIQDNSVDCFDYAGLVVNKPWGYEYLTYENAYVAAWILHLDKDQSTSMHCHPNKKTSLILLSGKIRVTLLTEWYDLKPLDGLIYQPGVFHSAKAITDRVFILEIETPPNKKDLVRLKDSYGRKGKSYERKSEMSHDLNKYKYIYFGKNDDYEKSEKNIYNTHISIKNGNLCQTDHVFHGTKKTYCLLANSKQKHTNGLEVNYGDIFSFNDLNRTRNINKLMLYIELKK